MGFKIGSLRKLATSGSAEVQQIAENAIAEIERLQFLASQSRTAAFEEAMNAVADLRVLAATDFKTPNCQGLRGQDRCDAFHDAYHAIRKIGSPSKAVATPKKLKKSKKRAK
jgi:hypothetical protein